MAEIHSNVFTVKLSSLSPPIYVVHLFKQKKLVTTMIMGLVTLLDIYTEMNIHVYDGLLIRPCLSRSINASILQPLSLIIYS